MTRTGIPGRTTLRVGGICGPCLAALLFSCLPAGPAAAMEIRHRERSLQPGEVVLLTASENVPLRRAEARAFGRTFPLYPTEDPRIWSGLVGIDLETRPGAYELEVSAEPEAGAPVTGKVQLRVLAKQFPTRRLTVDEKFVTPPPEVEDRIRREAARITAIHASVTPERLWGGVFRRPVPAEPGSSFGKRSILNRKPRSPHSGVDFSVPEGTEVRAPNSGRVVLAADLYYTGLTVILDHGLGMFSLFAHLAKIDVGEGELVRPGSLVGRVGMTGRSTGPHLHWSVRLVQSRVDPMALISVTGGRPGQPARKKK